MIPKFHIRWATDEDGSELERLAIESGVWFDNFDLDWSHPGHSWLYAVTSFGRGLAAVQVLAGTPIGRIEMLLLSQGMGRKQKTIVVRDLTDHATAVLSTVPGCQLVSSTIPDGLEGYLESAGNRGWVPADHSTVILKRLH